MRDPLVLKNPNTCSTKTFWHGERNICPGQVTSDRPMDYPGCISEIHAFSNKVNYLMLEWGIVFL